MPRTRGSWKEERSDMNKFLGARRLYSLHPRRRGWFATLNIIQPQHAHEAYNSAAVLEQPPE